MKKSLYLWALIAVVLIALTGCENKKLPVPKEIEIPASSKEILNGVKGYRVTSKMPGHTGESIFLPTQTYSADLETDWELEPGYELGLYWSSSVGDGNDDYYSPTPNLAYSLVFDYDTTPPTFDILNRFCRLSIRPVCK